MAGLDIICIGAINYDYMFHCTGLDLVETSAGGGDENLSNPISDVENDIQELAIKGKEYTTQIGGSAFITLKVAKHIRPVHSICASARQMTLTPSWRTWITVTGCLPRASASTIHIPKRLPNRLSAFIITRAIASRSRRVPTTLS